MPITSIERIMAETGRPAGCRPDDRRPGALKMTDMKMEDKLIRQIGRA